MEQPRIKNVFLLCGGITSQGNKEPVTCCTAESTVCCTVWSVLLGEGLDYARSEPPLTIASAPTVGSGTNCMAGIAACTYGGTWTTSCKARVTTVAIVLVRVDSISWEKANCVGAGDPGWILKTLTELVAARTGADALPGLELQCCGPPPDVSLQLSQGSLVPSWVAF